MVQTYRSLKNVKIQRAYLAPLGPPLVQIENANITESNYVYIFLNFLKGKIIYQT